MVDTTIGILSFAQVWYWVYFIRNLLICQKKIETFIGYASIFCEYNLCNNIIVHK